MSSKKYKHKLTENREVHKMVDAVIMYRNARIELISRMEAMHKSVTSSNMHLLTNERQKTESYEDFLESRYRFASDLVEYILEEFDELLEETRKTTKSLDKAIAKLNKERTEKLRKRFKRKVII